MSNPAIQASKEALIKLYKVIDNNQSFRFEAGAGAGKTYSLIKALHYLMQIKSLSLSKNNQQIACITYTNVAVKEISSRTDNHPIIFAGTIHSFCWSIIKDLQKQMRIIIPTLSDNWKNRVEESGGIKEQVVKYDLGYPSCSEKEISLYHDDVIRIFSTLLANAKFKALLYSKYPMIFIDEYQDTNKLLAESIVTKLIVNDSRFMVGFFGDHWQKIYGTGTFAFFDTAKDKITEISKNANFRSDNNIVQSLNKIRTELPQNPQDPDSLGEINIFITNSWRGNRRTGGHWQGDLPADIAHNYLIDVRARLEKSGWDFDPLKTKILMLTNNVLAEEQGYRNLASIFTNTDDYLKKNDNYISFLIDVVEPICESFENKKYGEMFKYITAGTVSINKHDDKKVWNNAIKRLIEIRKSGTIGDVIDYLKITEKPKVSINLESIEIRYGQLKSVAEMEEENKSFYDKITQIRSTPYSELIALSKYLDDETPFSTKHGVKGAEFENVLVVLGRGWNNYNWNDFLEWSNSGVVKGREEAYERNRNLFYVSITRSQKRLALLFTQSLSTSALTILKTWFGEDNIKDISL
ncbi:DNA helicase II [bacterium BRH_c32]|nr:MAG: DNA helicase II [bacterium BRH_c32]